MPISPSVAATPRTRSLRSDAVIVVPSGRSTNAVHTASSPTRSRSSARVGSGLVRVGNTAAASRAVPAYSAVQPGWSAAAPTRAKERRVASGSSATSSPRPGSAGSGV